MGRSRGRLHLETGHPIVEDERTVIGPCRRSPYRHPAVVARRFAIIDDPVRRISRFGECESFFAIRDQDLSVGATCRRTRDDKKSEAKSV
jgi:hypothetical protein